MLLVVGAAVLLPGRARADDPLPERATGAQVKSGQLLISVGLQDLFGPAERQHLTSGFSTRVLIRVALQDASREGGEPLALAVQRARDRLRHLGRTVQRPRDAGPGRRAARDRGDRRRGDLARDGAVAVPDRRHEPPARRRPLRRAGARAISIRSRRTCWPTCAAGWCSRRAGSGVWAQATASSDRSSASSSTRASTTASGRCASCPSRSRCPPRCRPRPAPAAGTPGGAPPPRVER